MAAEAGAQRLVLFHHEPEHTDAVMDKVVAAAQHTVRSKGLKLEVLAAQEGMQLTL